MSTTYISAPKGLVPLNLHEIWNYRDLAFFMLWRDLKGRYRQMALGPLWMIINPIMNVIIFSIIFGKMAKFPSDGIPYPLFNYSALLPWSFFTGCLFTAAVVGLSVGLWFASWIVHFRDVNAILGYMVRAWMYVTPVVYASSFIPEKWRHLYRLNPMANIIEGFRWALLGCDPPSWKMLFLSFAAVIPVLIGGAYYYRRTERSIVDIA